MFLKLLLLVLIFFVSTVLSQTDDEVLLITVDADEGCDVGSCQTGNEPCATINFALQALHQAGITISSFAHWSWPLQSNQK